MWAADILYVNYLQSPTFSGKAKQQKGKILNKGVLRGSPHSKQEVWLILLDMGEGRCFEGPRFSSGRGIRNEHSYKYTQNALLHEGICISYRKPGNRSREGMAIRHPAGSRIEGRGYRNQGEGLA